MSLVRWEPFRDLLSLQQRLNRGFESARQTSEEQLGTWAPAVDIYETEKEIVLKADLPGISLEDVDISLNNNVLSVRGERRFEKEVKEDHYHRVERVYGSFVRTFTLPNTVNVEQIEASYENGVLKIAMPKREEARPKQIKVNVKAA
jgi:HSP20 family protein